MSQAHSVESIYEQTVENIMTRDPVTLRPDSFIHAALELMSENRVSALPVIDRNGRCTGILSTTDIIDLTKDVENDLKQLDPSDPHLQNVLAQLANNVGNEKVQTFMSEAVTTVSLATKIGNAAKLMLRNRIHHLPVVDSDQHLIGIVSTMDILAVFADNAP